MHLDALTAISPVDGRYRSKVEGLAKYFSEYALIQYRVRVEVEYLIKLIDTGVSGDTLSSEQISSLRTLYTEFSEEDAQRIKEIERTTNHDVKAVEYFIKEKLEGINCESVREFVHFGLTSQDVNNTAIPLSIKEYIEESYLPAMQRLRDTLAALAEDWKDVSMLARTHGQPASPTRLGKEIMVFVSRLDTQLETLKNVPVPAKFGGATGNFNAHVIAFPQKDWKAFGTSFVEGVLGLSHSWPTTQIEHYDHLAALFHAMIRINNIILDLDRDMWTYISMEYFKQKLKEGEVGSSAMPHKVNPIDFENSEGNIGVANAIFEHLAAKLPVSRMQRDLTDSTVLRNVGVPFAHSEIAIQSSMKGLGKLLLNKAAFERDLEANWAVVAEAIQTILRREKYPNPYEALKALTRTNEQVNERTIAAFIDTLDVSDQVKAELKTITPSNYVGLV